MLIEIRQDQEPQVHTGEDFYLLTLELQSYKVNKRLKLTIVSCKTSITDKNNPAINGAWHHEMNESE